MCAAVKYSFVKKMQKQRYEKKWREDRKFSGCRGEKDQIVYEVEPLELEVQHCGCNEFPCRHVKPRIGGPAPILKKAPDGLVAPTVHVLKRPAGGTEKVDLPKKNIELVH